MEQDARELFNRYADRIYRIAMSYGNSVHFAEDIVQEVFLRYLKKEPRFENHEHEKAWFVRVTVNRCKNHWKSPWVRRRAAYWETAASCDPLYDAVTLITGGVFLFP